LTMDTAPATIADNYAFRHRIEVKCSKQWVWCKPGLLTM
jgi:hypothetical protein